MLPGKVPPKILEKLVFTHLGAGDKRVLIGSGKGIDAAAIEFGDRVLVASTDPITGAEENIGFYAIHINANDVATFGARPRWFLTSILLPETADEATLKGIVKELHENAASLGVSIVGGHTEVTPGLNRPVVVGTMLGEVNREMLVTSNGARPGDVLIVTKWIGLEGTSIIARKKRDELERTFGKKFTDRAGGLINLISVVKDALIAAKIGVNAMHDPTEGGIANGLHEMADAAGLGFKVYADRIPVREETLKICRLYGLDPLALISSGALLIAAPRKNASTVVSALEREGIHATTIGEFVGNPNVRVLVGENGEEELPQPKSDELWKLI
ncbi:AIR synthase family protein [Thermococcus sp.]|uniref:AIR synthase family protein n=1 Tax=Thermococcus sp. TaxID=35749 RepID=UPI0025F28205|nr:AIR synthase family protein [Thermococcus sp.]